MRPKISTIIPAWNSEATIAEALDSIGAQTLDCDNQIIIMDDGSTDTTFEIATNHPTNPLVVQQHNQGPAAALNAGLEKANGEFLAFLEHDDLWTPHKLALQMELLNTDPTLDFVFGYSQAFQCPSVPQSAFASLRFNVGLVPGYYIGTLFGRRESIVGGVGFWDPALRAGFFIDWMRRAKARNMRYDHVRSLVHKRRIRPNTLSKRPVSKTTQLDSPISDDVLEVARRSIYEKR